MNKINSLVVMFLFTLLIFGCNNIKEQTNGKGPENAKPININYNHVICNALSEDCFVRASFPDIESCQNYQQYSSALCDRVSYPGKIVCTLTASSSISTSYCIKN
jgi:hypothetical protein